MFILSLTFNMFNYKFYIILFFNSKLLILNFFSTFNDYSEISSNFSKFYLKVINLIIDRFIALCQSIVDFEKVLV